MNFNFILLPVYVVIFIIAVCGNSIFIAAISRNKKLHSAVYIFLANQSLSDLVFIVISVFMAIEFLMKTWIFGEVFCRILGPSIEVCYTVSILSLTAVTMERYYSICHLYLYHKRRVNLCLRDSGIIWLISIFVCSPLFYAYTVHIGTETKVNLTSTEITYRCGTQYWSKIEGLVFHCVHAAFIYILPLGIMIFAHSKIVISLKEFSRHDAFTRLRKIKYRNSCDVTIVSASTTTNNHAFSRTIYDRETVKMMKEHTRNLRILKLLTYITITFFVLWSPFIIGRVIGRVMYISEIPWATIQLLILVSSSINFFITMRMSPELRRTVLSSLKSNENN